MLKCRHLDNKILPEVAVNALDYLGCKGDQTSSYAPVCCHRAVDACHELVVKKPAHVRRGGVTTNTTRNQKKPISHCKNNQTTFQCLIEAVDNTASKVKQAQESIKF